MSLESINRKSGIYAFRKYGHFVTIGDIKYDEALSKWIVDLKVDYPLYIRDDSDPTKLIMKFLKLRNIGQLIYMADGELIEYPKKEECIAKVRNRLDFWHDKLENIVISASAYKLAKMSRFKHFLNPIMFIASLLIDEQSIYLEEFKHVSPSNIFRYIDLLENLELIKRERDLITYTPLFTLYLDKYKKESDFLEWVLAYVIQERYPTLKDFFNITQFIPTIQTGNCYYIPSLNADKLIHRTLDSITSDYTEWYEKKISPLDIKYWLKEWIDVGLLIYKNGYYYGIENIFEDMMNQKKNLPDRIPPLVYI